MYLHYIRLLFQFFFLVGNMKTTGLREYASHFSFEILDIHIHLMRDEHIINVLSY